MQIRACFPEASSISISVNTTQKEIDSFKKEVNEEFSAKTPSGVMTLDRGLDESQLFKYGNPLGDIKLTHNGS